MQVNLEKIQENIVAPCKYRLRLVFAPVPMVSQPNTRLEAFVVLDTAPPVKPHRRAEQWRLVQVAKGMPGLKPQHADPVRDHDLLLHCCLAWGWCELTPTVGAPGANKDPKTAGKPASIGPAWRGAIY